MARIEENIIQNSIPQGLKQKGLAVLGTIVTNQAMVFADQMIPALEKQLLTFSEGCPTSVELENSVNVRNNIVGQANSISNTLDKITSSVALASTGINTLTTLIRILKTAKVATSFATKFLPTAPGALTSAISDVDDLITSKTFDIEGNSKIAPIRSAIDGVSVPLSLISFYISKFISLLSTLDVIINECQPPTPLTPASEDLITISKVQNMASESPNLSTYLGFVLEIEIVPYSPTADRRRAVGKNSDGIVLIQTELSFTPVDQVMINELKFIIDRDNLKAN